MRACVRVVGHRFARDGCKGAPAAARAGGAGAGAGVPTACTRLRARARLRANVRAGVGTCAQEWRRTRKAVGGWVPAANPIFGFIAEPETNIRDPL